MSTRILLAMADRSDLEDLRDLFEQEPGVEIVGETTRGTEVAELTRALRPDVLLLEVGLSDLNGVAVTRQVREASPNTHVIALSSHSPDRIVASMLVAGASGYVSKAQLSLQASSAIDAVLHRRLYLSPDLQVRYAPESLHCAEPHRSEAASDEALSDREEGVLRLLAEGLSSKQMAAQLFVTTKTIEWHRRRIMDKLNIRSIAGLTHYAIARGLVPLEIAG